MRLRFISFSLVCLIIMVSVNSCEYSPTGANYVNCPVPVSTSTIDLNFSGDTILILSNVYLRYDINIETRHLIDNTNLYLDSTLIYYYSKLKDSISLGTYNIPNGIHTLTISATSNSGSESIADRRGREKVIFSKKWTLIFEVGLPSAARISSFTPADGMLKITWPKCTFHNFSYYSVMKNYTCVARIYNCDSTFYFDSSYTGKKTWYQIDITLPVGTNPGVESTFSDLPDVNDISTPEPFKFKINWHKSPYYRNINGYIIYKSPYISSSYVQIGTTNSINDTTFTDNNPEFGDKITYIVAPQTSVPYSVESGAGKSCFLGDTMIKAWSPIFNKPNNSVYVLNGNGILRLDGNTHNVLASQTSLNMELGDKILTVSSNGKYVYFAGIKNFFRLDPLTLNVTGSYSISSFTGNNSYILNSFQVNDSNMICYASWSNSYQLIGNTILDMNRKVLLASIPKEYSSGDFCAISDNNEFVFSGSGYFYKLISGKLISSGFISPGFLTFKGNGDEFIFHKNGSNNLSVMNSADLSITSTISCTNIYSYSFDAVSGKLAVNEFINPGNFIVIYDPVSGNEINRIAVVSGTYYFANSTLYNTSNGVYYLKLNFNGGK